MCIVRGFYWLRELYEVFRRTPSQGGRGRRAAVDFVVCFGATGFRFYFS